MEEGEEGIILDEQSLSFMDECLFLRQLAHCSQTHAAQALRESRGDVVVALITLFAKTKEQPSMTRED